MAAWLPDVIAPVLATVATLAIPVVGGLVGQGILTVLQKRNLDTAWFEAISRAGGEAYRQLLASGRPVTDKTALLEAAQAGATYLQARVPTQIITRQLQGHDLRQIASAEVGKLLAQDPTVGPVQLAAPQLTP